MKSFISSSSIKFFKSIAKNIPSKVYSVEIKIKRNDISAINNVTPQTNIVSPASTLSPTSENNSSHQPISKYSDDLIQTQEVQDFTESSQDFPAHSELIDYTRKLVKTFHSKSNCLNQIGNKPSLKQTHFIISLNKLMTNLNSHFHQYPESVSLAIEDNIIPKLIDVRQISELKAAAASAVNETKSSPDVPSQYRLLSESSRQLLSQLGYADPPKGRGVRILSIDGGGKLSHVCKWI